mgnify:CR=1 FL=1
MLLHTHVVIANHALGPDGRRTALYGRVVYDESKTAGYVYQAVLRHELTTTLGVGLVAAVGLACAVTLLLTPLVRAWSGDGRRTLRHVALPGLGVQALLVGLYLSFRPSGFEDEPELVELGCFVALTFGYFISRGIAKASRVLEH